MTHSRLQRQLSPYLDNELTASDAADVRAHLEGCALCRGELHRMTQLKRLLGSVPARTPPHDLWVSVRARLQDPQPHAGLALADALRAAFRRPAAAVAAAALVLLLIALPLAKGRIDRLRAGELGVDVYVREHALAAVADPFADRAYLGLLVGDANLALAGEPRREDNPR